jgi:hypothetical protein
LNHHTQQKKGKYRGLNIYEDSKYSSRVLDLSYNPCFFGQIIRSY